MKLTLAFLAALAAVDAAEARTHRQARRQYGVDQPPAAGNYGSGYGTGSSPKPVETPSPSSVAQVTYNQSTAPAFETSAPPNGASSYPPVKATPSPAGYPAAYPPKGGESSSAVPVVSSPPVPSSSLVPGDKSSSVLIPTVPSSKVPSPESSSAAPPAGGYGGYPVDTPKSSATPEASSAAPTPSGVYPSGGSGYPVKPSGGASSVPVEASSKASSSVPVYVASSSVPAHVASSGVYPSGGAGYPTGTGSKPTTTCTTSKGEKTPLPTSSAPVEITSKIPHSEVIKTMTETFVYTVGVGSTAHPVTTVYQTTSTETLYKTIIVKPSKPSPAQPEKSAYPQGGNGGGYPAETPEGTTTIHSTTTSTKYITVKPTPTGSYPTGGKPETPAKGHGNSESPAKESCPAPVYVTVTAKETVTVTAEVPSKASATPDSYPTQPKPEVPGKSEVPAGGNKPSPVPYPVGNGTHPYPAGPTGFKTSTKVPSPSKSTGLPYFSFESEIPSATPASKTPVESKSSATPASKTPVESKSSATPAVSSAAGYPAYTPSKPEETPSPSSKAPAGGEGYPVAPKETPAPSSKAAPSSEYTKPTPTPANSYGSGYGTY